MKKQIFKNIFSSYLVKSIGILLGFLLIPFLIQKLGREAFGLIVLSESTIIFFEILTTSVRSALSRHATFSLAQSNKRDFIEYLSTGRGILFISTGLVFITGTIISYNFANIFKVPPLYVEQSKILFFLITIAFSISIPNMIFWSVLFAKQRFDLINISASAVLIVRAVSIFVLYSILPQKYISLVMYGFIYLAVVYIRNSTIYWLHKKIMPDIKINIRHFTRAKVKEILSFTSHSSLGRISYLLFNNTAIILINIFWGAGSNAIYAISLKLPTMMRRIFNETTWSLTPTFTNLLAKDDKEKFELLFFMYSKFVSIVTVPLSLMLIFLAKPIISFWVGDEFILASKILPIHVLPLLITLPFAVTSCVTNAYAKLKIPSKVNLGVAVLNVGFIVILGKVFALKLFGVAIATAISTFLYVVLFKSYYTCKIANVSLRRYWIESFIKPTMWACIIIGGSFLLIAMIQSGFQLTPILFFILIPSLLLYYISAYKLILNLTEKEHIRELFKLVLTKPRVNLELDNGS